MLEYLMNNFISVFFKILLGVTVLWLIYIIGPYHIMHTDLTTIELGMKFIGIDPITQ